MSKSRNDDKLRKLELEVQRAKDSQEMREQRFENIRKIFKSQYIDKADGLAGKALLHHAVGLMTSLKNPSLIHSDGRLLYKDQIKQLQEDAAEAIEKNLGRVFAEDPKIIIDWFKEKSDVPTAMKERIADIYMSYLDKQNINENINEIKTNIAKIFAEQNSAKYAVQYFIAAHDNNIVISPGDYAKLVRLIYSSGFDTPGKDQAILIAPVVAAQTAKKVVASANLADHSEFKNELAIAQFQSVLEERSLFKNISFETLKELYSNNRPALTVIAFRNLLTAIKQKNFNAAIEAKAVLENSAGHINQRIDGNNQISRTTYEQLYVDALVRNNEKDLKQLLSRNDYPSIHISLKDSFHSAVQKLFDKNDVDKKSDMKTMHELESVKQFMFARELTLSENLVAQAIKSAEVGFKKDQSTKEKLLDQWERVKTKGLTTFAEKFSAFNAKSNHTVKKSQEEEKDTEERKSKFTISPK